jgi:hypothetical protein
VCPELITANDAYLCVLADLANRSRPTLD